MTQRIAEVTIEHAAPVEDRQSWRVTASDNAVARAGRGAAVDRLKAALQARFGGAEGLVSVAPADGQQPGEGFVRYRVTVADSVVGADATAHVWEAASAVFGA